LPQRPRHFAWENITNQSSVFVNGDGPFPFILDTGSTHSSIAAQLAQALGVPAVARTTVTSSLGQHVQPVVNLQSLQIGPATTINVLATEVADEELGNKRDVRGVLGQDVLGSLVYTLDFAARRVEWNPDIGVPREGDFWQSCRRRNRRCGWSPIAAPTLWCSMNGHTCSCRRSSGTVVWPGCRPFRIVRP
jgi:hypothetical protein